MKGDVKLFTMSIYHPVDNNKQIRFQEVVTLLLGKIPRNYEIISGQDLNVSIGVRKMMKTIKK